MLWTLTPEDTFVKIKRKKKIRQPRKHTSLCLVEHAYGVRSIANKVAEGFVGPFAET